MRTTVMTSPNSNSPDLPNKATLRKSRVTSSLRKSRNKADTQAPRNKGTPRRSTAQFTLPDLPREQWCDIRTSYIEMNLPLSELAEI